MARASCVLVLALATVCISASPVEEVVDGDEKRLFDSLAPLLNNSPKQGDLGASMGDEPIKGADDSVTAQFSEINKKLLKAKPNQVASLLDQHITSGLWEKWGVEVRKKKLNKETAQSVLNSYLLANVNDAKVLVKTVDWVKQKAHPTAAEAKVETAVEEGKERAKAMDAAAKKASSAKGEKPVEKPGAAKAAKEEETAAEVEKAEAVKEQKEAKKAEKDAEKAEKDAEKEKAQAVEDSDKKVAEAKHEQKEKKLESKIEEVKAKAEAEKEKSEQKVEAAKKQVEKKAAAEIKAAKDQAAAADKEKKKAEAKADKAETEAEKKVAKAKEAASVKVQEAQKKVDQKVEEKVTAAKVKAEKKVIEAKEETKAAVKAVTKAEETKQTATQEKQVKPEANSAQEAKAAKKVQKEISAAETAAVTQIAPQQVAAPAKGEIQKLADKEKVAEAKTLSLTQLISQSKAKVADATQILIHATKMNKFVRKADELLKIAKMSQAAVLSEAKKQEAITETSAHDLKDLEAKSAKAKLAEYKLVLENAIKDAKQIVDAAEAKLKARQDALQTSRDAIVTDQDSLKALRDALVPANTKLAKDKAQILAEQKELKRAEGGLRLAQQSEIPEAVRIATERVQKLHAARQTDKSTIAALEGDVTSQQAKIKALEAGLKMKQANSDAQAKAVEQLKSVELPKLQMQTQMRVKALETSMGKKMEEILKLLKDTTPKGLQKAREAVGKPGSNNPLELERQKRVAAEASAATLQQELNKLKSTQKMIVQTMEGPGVKKSAADSASVSKVKANTDKAVGQVNELKSLKGELESKKAELETELSTAAPGSAKEVQTLKELEKVNEDERAISKETAEAEEKASKDTATLAKLAKQTVADQKKIQAVKMTEASLKADAAKASISTDLARISDSKKKIEEDKAQATTIEGKIQEIKLLIKAGNGTDLSGALKQLEAFEGRAAALREEEAKLCDLVEKAEKDVKTQKATISNVGAQLAKEEKASEEKAEKMVAIAQKAIAEHEDVASHGALDKAKAEAVTATEETEKVQADSKAKLTSSQHEVAALKEKLAASSAAAEAAASGAAAFVKKIATGGAQIKAKLKSDVAAVTKATKQASKLEALAQKAESKVASAKAEAQLAEQENNPSAVAKAQRKVEKYQSDQKKVEAAKGMIKSHIATKKIEIQQLAKAQKSEDVMKEKMSDFERRSLQKWNQVHQMAQAGAKTNQADRMQQTVAENQNLLQAKDNEIAKLKLALNLAINPAQVKQVAKLETKEERITKELERSENSLSKGIKKEAELQSEERKARAEGDQHKEISYGAQLEDLKVALSRARLHVEGLKLSLEKERNHVAATERLQEVIKPATPAAKVVHLASTQTDSQEARAMKLIDSGKAQSDKVERLTKEAEEKIDTAVAVATDTPPALTKPKKGELAESNSLKEQDYMLLQEQLKLERQENQLIKMKQRKHNA